MGENTLQKKMISELKHIATKTIHNKTEYVLKKKSRELISCGGISSNLKYMQLESQLQEKRREEKQRNYKCIDPKS